MVFVRHVCKHVAQVFTKNHIFVFSNVDKVYMYLPLIVASYRAFGHLSSRWWFDSKIFFIFSPKIGEMIQFDLRIFFKWVVQQPQCLLSRHSRIALSPPDVTVKDRGGESSTSNHGTVVQKRDGRLFLWQFLGTNKPSQRFKSVTI